MCKLTSEGYSKVHTDIHHAHYDKYEHQDASSIRTRLDEMSRISTERFEEVKRQWARQEAYYQALAAFLSNGMRGAPPTPPQGMPQDLQRTMFESLLAQQRVPV